MKSRHVRTIAFSLFALISVAGSIYYWFNGSLHLRNERRVMWTGAVEWWQGMAGHLLTQHREGIQVAELSPATGQLLTVHDLYVDAGGVAPALERLSPGHWLVISGLELGSPEQTGRLKQVLSEKGWKGKLDAFNEGAGILILTRCADGTHFCPVAADLGGGATAAVHLPAGTRGPDGEILRHDFAVKVQGYD